MTGYEHCSACSLGGFSTPGYFQQFRGDPSRQPIERLFQNEKRRIEDQSPSQSGTSSLLLVGGRGPELSRVRNTDQREQQVESAPDLPFAERAPEAQWQREIILQ